MLDYLLKMLLCGGLLGIIALIVCLIKKYPARKLVYMVIFAVYAGALLAFTLWRTPTPGMPRMFNIVPFGELRQNLQRQNYHHIFQMLVNVGMYIPLGALLKVGRRKFKWVLIISLVSSLVIEAIQIALNIGSFDIDDIILNLIGALVGYLLAALFTSRKVLI